MRIDFPDNPTTASYPTGLQAISAFCSGCFQYMLIMTETVYLVPPENQKLFFNEGLHRSMIWVLDKYIKTIRQIPLGPNPSGGPFMAPTFENVDLGPRVSSFSALSAMGVAAIDAAQAIIDADPKGPLADVMNDVIYYIGVATTNNSDGHRMCLPDVAQYWINIEA